MLGSSRLRLTHTTALTLAAAGAFGVASTSLPAANAASPSHTAASAAATKSRTQVPWKSVGTGWVAADVLRDGTNHLVLASPDGTVYEIATIGADDHVVAISPDGTHAATTRWKAGDPHPQVWDMRTGTSTSVPMTTWSLAFSRPGGGSVMGFDLSNTYGRYGNDGAAHRVVTAQTSSVGVSPAIIPGGRLDAVTSTVDGTPVVAVYDHATFTRQRTLTRPSGSTGCRAIGWKNATTLLEHCTLTSAKGGTHQEVFAQNVTGGAPKAVTTGGAPGSSTYTGFSDAATTSIGDVAISFNDNGDGPGPVYRLSGTHAATKIGPTSLNANGGAFAGGYATSIVGDKIVYASSPLGARSTDRMVAEYDVRTKKLTYLVGNNSKYTGEVGGFAAIDPRR